jgi:hypothetical protein
MHTRARTAAHAQLGAQAVNLGAHVRVRLVVAARVGRGLYCGGACERVVALRRDVVERCLQLPVLVQQRLVDLGERLLFCGRARALGLQRVVSVVPAGVADG